MAAAPSDEKPQVPEEAREERQPEVEAQASRAPEGCPEPMAVEESAAPAGSAAEPPVAQAEEPAECKQLKRPKTAFWLFQEEFRGQVAAELGTGTGVAKIASALAAKWKQLEEASQAKYLERAKELKAQYDKDIAAGAVPATSAKKKKAARAAARKANTATKRMARRRRTLETLKRRAGPKKPKGSYSIWLCEHRERIRAQLVEGGVANPSFEEIARATGKAWLALTDEQKAPYVERSRALFDKYKVINKACKEYKHANVEDAKTTQVKKKAAKARKQASGKTAKKAAGKAKKQAPVKAKKQKPEPANSKEEKAETAKAVATPQKRASGAARPTPKKTKKAEAEVKTAYLDMAVLAEAEQAGFAGTFRKLAEREDLRSHPQRKLLDALVASGGLLHRAKETLLAGSA